MQANQSVKAKKVFPAEITGSYTFDYNIAQTDRMMKELLEDERSDKIKQLHEAKHKLEQEIQRPQTLVQRKDCYQRLQELLKQIEAIESGTRQRQYLEATASLVKEYNKLQTHQEVVTVGKGKKHPVLDEVDQERLRIIGRYLHLLKDFIPVNVIRIQHHPTQACLNCGASLADVAVGADDIQECPVCKTEHSMYSIEKSSNKDGMRLQLNSEVDDSLANFLKAFVQYQGLQSTQPAETLYAELDKYFTGCRRPIGAEIRKLPLNTKGYRGDTNHKMLLKALADIGHSSHYEDVNLIGHVYWDWPLPNVNHLKDQIIQDYKKTQDVFYSIPVEERRRSSSLGTQFRLWRHLQLRGHPCYPEQFKISDNETSLSIHNYLWDRMCRECNDNEIQERWLEICSLQNTVHQERREN